MNRARPAGGFAASAVGTVTFMTRIVMRLAAATATARPVRAARNTGSFLPPDAVRASTAAKWPAVSSRPGATEPTRLRVGRATGRIPYRWLGRSALALGLDRMQECRHAVEDVIEDRS